MEKSGDRPGIKPGSGIDIVWQEAPDGTSIRLLSAMIYDVVDERIVLSQTQPPLTRSHLGRTLELTFRKRNSNICWGSRSS